MNSTIETFKTDSAVFEEYFPKLPYAIHYKNPYGSSESLYKIYMDSDDFYEIGYMDAEGNLLDGWADLRSHRGYGEAAEKLYEYLEKNDLLAKNTVTNPFLVSLNLSHNGQ